MPTMKLRNVPYGTTFTAFGETFVALDYIGGGVLAIRRDNWKNAAFDEDGKNNLKTASIGGKLNNFLNVLEDGGAARGDILPMTVDLKATDGTREYGFCETRIGLLTLEQYGKYQHIIPDADGPWWLATPWRTPGEKCGSSVGAWLVVSNGHANGGGCSGTGYYLRPALILSSNLLISIEDEEEQGGGKTEAETYAEYCAYVEEWAEYANDGGQDQGTSPLTYEEWKEENAERVEAE